MKNYIVFLSLLVCTLSCKDNSGETKIGSNEVEHINTANSFFVDNEISPRELMTDVSYIVLETDEFFLTEAQKIIEFNNHLLIHDKNKKKLVAFNLDGKFIQQIGQQGFGPEEYQSVYDFDIDYNNELIYILSRADMSIIVFDKTFKYLRRINFDYYPYLMSVLDDGNIAIYQSYDNGGDHNITVIDSNGKIVSERMPYPKNGTYIATDYTGFLKGQFFTYPFSSIIYRIDSKSIVDKAVYKLDFPNKRKEDSKFEHQSYFYANQQDPSEILGKFTIGDKNEELMFFYSLKQGGKVSYPIGIKLKSGQLFSHTNMNHGAYFQNGDIFTDLFLFGFYNLPEFSRTSGFYYVATNSEYMTDFFNDKAKYLNDASKKDPELEQVLVNLMDDKEYSIIMRFKLKPSYDE